MPIYIVKVIYLENPKKLYDLEHKEYLLGILLPKYCPSLNAGKSNLLQAGKGKTIFVD